MKAAYPAASVSQSSVSPNKFLSRCCCFALVNAVLRMILAYNFDSEIANVINFLLDKFSRTAERMGGLSSDRTVEIMVVAVDFRAIPRVCMIP